jgi:hypothetical protein
MDRKNLALAIAGLVGLGVFLADVAARSQAASTVEGWTIHSGAANEVWKLNTRTGELYFCITAQAQPKVVCSK